MKTSNDELRTSMMKTAALCLILTAMSAMAQPAPPGPRPMPRPLPPGTPPPYSAEMTNAPSNYVVRVEWKDTNTPGAALEVLTGEGHFQVNSSLPQPEKSGGSAIPIPVNFEGTLKVLNSEQGQLQLFLGRSISYSLSGPGQASSIQQRQEGLSITFYVTFGKSVLARRDANGEVSILVKKQAP